MIQTPGDIAKAVSSPHLTFFRSTVSFKSFHEVQPAHNRVRVFDMYTLVSFHVCVRPRARGHVPKVSRCPAACLSPHCVPHPQPQTAAGWPAFCHHRVGGISWVLCKWNQIGCTWGFSCLGLLYFTQNNYFEIY